MRGLGRLVICGLFAAIVLVGPQAAGADPFSAWSGQSGPYAWEAKRLSCGTVGEELSRVRAHTRWSTSPRNGYHRVTFDRQLLNEETGTWTTVQQRRWSTRNTSLEGSRSIIHWSQWFQVPADNAGKTSRHRVHFEWLRDREGPDPRLFNRWRTFAPCVVG
jgi:hypothetical protein